MGKKGGGNAKKRDPLDGFEGGGANRRAIRAWVEEKNGKQKKRTAGQTKEEPCQTIKKGKKYSKTKKTRWATHEKRCTKTNAQRTLKQKQKGPNTTCGNRKVSPAANQTEEDGKHGETFQKRNTGRGAI